MHRNRHFRMQGKEQLKVCDGGILCLGRKAQPEKDEA